MGRMITSAQIRAGRGLLKWTQATLAAQAAVSIVTLNMIETEQVAAREKTLAAIRRALENGGVRFIGDDASGRGVLLGPNAPTPDPAATEPPRSPARNRHGRAGPAWAFL